MLYCLSIPMVMSETLVRCFQSAMARIPTVRAGVCLCPAQNTILNVSCITTIGHPDAFFEQNTIDTAQAIRKNRKALFKMKCFKMHETRRIQRSSAVLIGTKIVSTLIKDDFLVNFCQQK